MSAFILKPLLKHFFVLCVVALLAACETDLGDEDLRIVNQSRLPKAFTYYVAIDFPIEIAGGNGGYSVRYIQNPEEGMSEEEIEDASSNNPLALKIVKDLDTQGNTFRLQGIPLPAENIGELESTYWIEFTDGIHVKRRRVDFEINAPDIDTKLFFGKRVTEAVSDIRSLTDALDRSIPLCDSSSLSVPQVFDSPYGKAYPYMFLLGFKELLSVDVTLKYQLGKVASSGVKPARAYSDYLPVEGEVVVKAGELGCPINFYVIDDPVIEGDETVSVSITGIEGMLTPSNAVLSGVFTIIDNEPRLNQFGAEYTVNEHESVEIPISLSGLVSNSVFVQIGRAHV